MFKSLNIKMFKCSNVQIFKCLNVQMSNTKYHMSNVNKVKLLSERTSGHFYDLRFSIVRNVSIGLHVPSLLKSMFVWEKAEDIFIQIY